MRTFLRRNLRPFESGSDFWGRFWTAGAFVKRFGVNPPSGMNIAAGERGEVADGSKAREVGGEVGGYVARAAFGCFAFLVNIAARSGLF